MNLSTSNITNKIDIFLLFLLVMSSGNPAFSQFGGITYITVFLISYIVFFKRQLKFDKTFMLFFAFLILLTFLQTLIFNFISVITVLGLFTRVLLAYIILKILNVQFFEKYINLLYFFSIISIILFLFLQINPNILYPFSFISGEHRISFLGIYTIVPMDMHRNAGPFWEPGAFGGYLILAIIFNLFKTKKLLEKKNIIFLITIVTTQSTTAYLALLTLLFFYFYKEVKNALFKLIIIPIVIGGAYLAYTNLEFLGQKIEQQIAAAESQYDIRANKNTQRFLNILRDYNDIQGYELTGRGTHPFTRYSFDPTHQIRTVGITDIMVKFGIPFFLLMMYFLFKSICSYILYFSKTKELSYCIGGFLTLMVSLMSEVYFNYPLYWSLLFLHLIYIKPENKENPI